LNSTKLFDVFFKTKGNFRTSRRGGGEKMGHFYLKGGDHWLSVSKGGKKGECKTPKGEPIIGEEKAMARCPPYNVKRSPSNLSRFQRVGREERKQVGGLSLIGGLSVIVTKDSQMRSEGGQLTHWEEGETGRNPVPQGRKTGRVQVWSAHENGETDRRAV